VALFVLFGPTSWVRNCYLSLNQWNAAKSWRSSVLFKTQSDKPWVSYLNYTMSQLLKLYLTILYYIMSQLLKLYLIILYYICCHSWMTNTPTKGKGTCFTSRSRVWFLVFSKQRLVYGSHNGRWRGFGLELVHEAEATESSHNSKWRQVARAANIIVELGIKGV